MSRIFAIAIIATCTVGLGGIGYITAARIMTDNAQRSAPQDPKAKAEPFLVERGKKIDLAPLKSAARQSPTDPKALAALGIAALSQNDFLTAKDALEKSLERDPKQPGLWSALGETYLHLERSETSSMPPSARAAFDTALKQDPGDIRARFYIALEKDYSGQHDEAIGEWLALLRQVPRGSHPDGAIRAAIKASVENNVALIRRAMDKVVKDQPTPATADQKSAT